jgi:hypothetical protein
MTNSLSKNFNLLPVSFKRELSLKSFLTLTGGSLLGLACFYLGKIWYSYRFFAKMNIKTPKFKYLYGNLAEIMKNVIIDIFYNNSFNIYSISCDVYAEQEPYKELFPVQDRQITIR